MISDWSPESPAVIVTIEEVTLNIFGFAGDALSIFGSNSMSPEVSIRSHAPKMVVLLLQIAAIQTVKGAFLLNERRVFALGPIPTSG